MPFLLRARTSTGRLFGGGLVFLLSLLLYGAAGSAALAAASQPRAQGDALPCWFYQPSVDGQVGAVGVARAISVSQPPLQIARVRAISGLLGGVKASLNATQAQALSAGEPVTVGGATVFFGGHFEADGYIYAHATLNAPSDRSSSCLISGEIAPEHCEPSWVCQPVQNGEAGFVGVSARAETLPRQFELALANAITLMEYTYGVSISGVERYLRTSGSTVGAMNLRLREYDVSRSERLPETVRVYVKELRFHGDHLYLWLAAPGLPAFGVAKDLSWRTQPSQNGVFGEVGTAGRTWDGRLSTQIETAMKRALYNLAKSVSSDVTTIDVIRSVAPGTQQGRATMIKVQQQLSAQLLAVHIRPEADVAVWVGRPAQ